MPKRKQYNAFGTFLKEFRNDMAKRGKFIKSKDMISQAHSKWKTLSAKDQEKYKVKANQEKAEARAEVVDQPHVVTFDEIRRQKLKDEVQTLVERIRPEKVVEAKFYLIFFNISCKVEPDKIHIPVEVGLVEYSIAEGILKEYQKFIDPGKPPIGYRFTCIENSESTHGIPFEKFEKASNEYKAILKEIKEFTNNCGKLYTLPDDLLVSDYTEQTVSCLNWLAKNAEIDDEIDFKVYNLLDLFKCLAEVKGDDSDETTIKSYISAPTYDYQPKMGCEWHDAADRNKYCSLAFARKCGYILSDILCGLYHIEMISGKHGPELEDGSVVMKSNVFKLSTANCRDLTQPKEKGASAAILIKPTGKSSVFQPDSVDIYGDKM